MFDRFGTFCTVVALSALTVHSIAAARPFATCITRCPLRLRRPRLRHRSECAIHDSMAEWLGGPDLGNAVTPLALAVFALTLFCPQEGQRTLRFIVNRNAAQGLTMYATESNWSLALPMLRPLADAADHRHRIGGCKGTLLSCPV